MNRVDKEELLLEYLYKNIDASKKNIKSLLTHGSVLVDNKVTTQYNYVLKKGQTVSINKHRC